MLWMMDGWMGQSHASRGLDDAGGKSKVRNAGVFSRHLVAVMAGVLPFAGGEYRSRVDRVVRRIAIRHEHNLAIRVLANRVVVNRAIIANGTITSRTSSITVSVSVRPGITIKRIC